MTSTDVLNKLACKEITTQEASQLLATMTRPTTGGKRIIKRNTSGGLFVMDGSFRCYSTAKSKHYTGSFNMDKDVAKALFSNPELLAEITAFVNS